MLDEGARHTTRGMEKSIHVVNKARQGGEQGQRGHGQVQLGGEQAKPGHGTDKCSQVVDKCGDLGKARHVRDKCVIALVEPGRSGTAYIARWS
jgi:hypothetical protein